MRRHSRHPFPNREDPGVAAGHPSAAAAAVARVPSTAPRSRSACASTTCRRAARTCSTSSCSPRTTSTAASTPCVHRNDLDDADAARRVRRVRAARSSTRTSLLQEQYRRPAAAARHHRRGARARPTARRSSCAASSPTSSPTATGDWSIRCVSIPSTPRLRHRAVAAAQGARAVRPAPHRRHRSSTSGAASCAPADVGIVGPLVASVHDPGTRTDALDALDCTGRFVAPGLHRPARALRVVDAHAGRLRRGGVPARHHHRVRRPARARERRRRRRACATRSRRAAGCRCASSCRRRRAFRRSPASSCPAPTCSGPTSSEMLAWDEVGGLAEVMDMLGVLGVRRPHGRRRRRRARQRQARVRPRRRAHRVRCCRRTSRRG